MGDVMFCDICGAETEIRHGVDLRCEVWHPFITAVYIGSTRVIALSSGKGKRNPTDLVIQRSKELYGYTPEEKSDENMDWMLQNGYVTLGRYKCSTLGRQR